MKVIRDSDLKRANANERMLARVGLCFHFGELGKGVNDRRLLDGQSAASVFAERFGQGVPPFHKRIHLSDATCMTHRELSRQGLEASERGVGHGLATCVQMSGSRP